MPAAGQSYEFLFQITSLGFLEKFQLDFNVCICEVYQSNDSITNILLIPGVTGYPKGIPLSHLSSIYEMLLIDHDNWANLESIQVCYLFSFALSSNRYSCEILPMRSVVFVVNVIS
ncbi:uncharacterized protein LOC132048353 [Lycium ferocissimum]|uniref:uncharacterized protein LOC132048353 n=1 Tax=Lycium ferocissimum TaxID=112874 RepID=UPI002815328C|nr:uncharacterized protein LOC132048353 [Lycium ferocissimum]